MPAAVVQRIKYVPAGRPLRLGCVLRRWPLAENISVLYVSAGRESAPPGSRRMAAWASARVEWMPEAVASTGQTSALRIWPLVPSRRSIARRRW